MARRGDPPASPGEQQWPCMGRTEALEALGGEWNAEALHAALREAVSAGEASRVALLADAGADTERPWPRNLQEE
eukprot:CAMPEP_0198424916 /NCGR_PEP_ID=MMETSP1452-20131203/4212_1 /TAXON_ID=1181717 /ORGANISM="Synchroma pusillum, Strain CCMP3072" /LENGTH=74 /DNA_ID=CAMNT_0044145269 /DNA_START=27 /DNA_END=248 /DNA_ORIENTATION=+